MTSDSISAASLLGAIPLALLGVVGCSGAAKSSASSSSNDSLVDAASYDDDCDRPEAVEAGAAGVIDVTEPSESIQLDDTGKVYRLADGCTLLQFRKVHSRFELGPGGFYPPFAKADHGLPYASTHGGWIELLHGTKLYRRGLVFDIQNQGCQAVERSCGDCSYQEVASCSLTVTTTPERPAPIVPADIDKSFSFATRYDAVQVEATGGTFAAVRDLGFDMGNIDMSVKPPEPRGVDGAIDVVTGFGVANIDIAYFNEQVIGAMKTFSIGPSSFVMTIEDVGNTNTHCYTGQCIDIFKLHIRESVDDPVARVPVVLEYR